MLGGRQAGPVIEPGASKRVLGGVEAERMDEVERATQGHARPPDIPRVVGDFRLVQDDVEKRVHGAKNGVGVDGRGTGAGRNVNDEG